MSIYGSLWNRGGDNVQQFLSDFLKKGDDYTKALRLMELQRNAQLMYTSCGWFFDEVSGIETTQIMQYACRAIQLASQVGGQDLEPEFLKHISKAQSNLPEHKDAGHIYTKYVVPAKVDLERVGMHYSIASIFAEEPESCPVFNYTAQNDFFERREAGTQRLTLGVTKIRSGVTHSENKFSFAVLYLGHQNIIGNISIDMSRELFDEMRAGITDAFNKSNLGEVFSVMQKYFGPEKYNLWHLFKDEKREVLKQIMERSLKQVEGSFRRIYNRDYQLINSLLIDEIPLPSAYITTLQYTLNADLMAAFNENHIDLEELKRIKFEFDKWNIALDNSLALEQQVAVTVFKALERISRDKGNVERLDRLNSFFSVLKYFNLEPGLYKSQNLYFQISINQKDCGLDSADWYKAFAKLGDHLKVKAY